MYQEHHEYNSSLLCSSVACLQAVCGCFYRGKIPQNAEFAMASAILDVRENRSGGSETPTNRLCGSVTSALVRLMSDHPAKMRSPLGVYFFSRMKL